MYRSCLADCPPILSSRAIFPPSPFACRERRVAYRISRAERSKQRSIFTMFMNLVSTHAPSESNFQVVFDFGRSSLLK